MYFLSLPSLVERIEGQHTEEKWQSSGKVVANFFFMHVLLVLLLTDVEAAP